MQDIKLVCTLDGAEYKEYKVFVNQQLVGVISWKGELKTSEFCWYTTASDGNLRYFQSQEEAIEFLINDPLKSTNELSAKLKAEANKLIDIAEEIEESTDPKSQDHC